MKKITLILLLLGLCEAKAQIKADDSVQKYRTIRNYYLKYAVPIDSNGVYYNQKYEYWRHVYQSEQDSSRIAKYQLWVIKKRLRLAKRLGARYHVNLKYSK